jgi:hypothetical protein
MTWEIRTHQTVKRFQASFPEHTDKPGDPYVTVSTTLRTECLKKVERIGASGHQVFVSPRSSLPAGEPATAEAAAELRYYWFRLRHDSILQLSTAGLVIGVAGIVMDTVRDGGLVAIDSLATTLLKVGGYALKTVGLLIVFVAAILKEEG